jgi:hypothetical protein
MGTSDLPLMLFWKSASLQPRTTPAMCNMFTVVSFSSLFVSFFHFDFELVITYE